jgi:hypothetical protein
MQNGGTAGAPRGDGPSLKRKNGGRSIRIINFRVTRPDYSQNQTAVSDTLRLLYDF